MEPPSLFDLEDFEEEKVVHPYDDMEMEPIHGPACSDFIQEHESLHLPLTKEDRPSPVPKCSRQRRQSMGDDKNLNRGHWLFDENKKYHWFL